MKPPENGEAVAAEATTATPNPTKGSDSSEVSNADAGEIINMDERRDLVRLEAVIDKGLDTFVHVGNALAEIRDRKLYRVEHKTFEDYCRDKWNMSRFYAHRVIEAAETAAALPIGNRENITTESQARELAKVEPAHREEVVAAAVEATGGKVTAAAIKSAALEIVPPKKSEAETTREKRPRAPRVDGFYRVTLNIEMDEVLSVERVEALDASTVTLVVCSESHARYLLKKIKPAKFSKLLWRHVREAAKAETEVEVAK